MSVDERLGSALFLSVSARSDGMRTARLDEPATAPASYGILAVLMFVGGAPASCAGGVTLLALAMGVVFIRRTWRGDGMSTGTRGVYPRVLVQRAAAVLLIVPAIIAIAAILLAAVESHPLSTLLFEATSATTNAGLSAGITPGLTRAGKLILVLAMGAGRILPMIALFGLAARTPAAANYSPPASLA